MKKKWRTSTNDVIITYCQVCDWKSLTFLVLLVKQTNAGADMYIYAQSDLLSMFYTYTYMCFIAYVHLVSKVDRTR